MLGELAPESVTERADEVTWVPGLRLLAETLVVPRWDALEDHEPGQQGLILNGRAQGRWLLSIDEETAGMCIGDIWSVLGSGLVRVTHGDRSRIFRAGDHFDLVHALDMPHASESIGRIERNEFFRTE